MKRVKGILALLAAAAVLTASSLAQEPAPPATRPAPPAGEREQTPRPAPPAEERERAPPAGGEASNASEDEFVPTEELQPDAAVTFPVDI
jgi:hypothetical protein